MMSCFNNTSNRGMNNNTQKIKLSLLLILGALLTVTSLATDTYLPAMPTMATQLGGNVELTISGFLAGFAIAQLIWGPISDRIGRKIPLFIGMAIFIVGSLGCAFSDNIVSLVIWRVIQAIGACTAPMLGRAMVRDLYQRQEAARVLSILTLVLSIAPIAGPFIGALILEYFNWHGIFIMLAIIGVLLFLALFSLAETHPIQKRATTRPWYASFGNYGKLLKNATFMRYTLCIACFYVGVYAFVTASPYLYIEYFHIPPQHFAWLFSVNILGVMTLSVVNTRLVSRYPFDRLLKTASAIAFAAILGLGFMTLIGWHHILVVVIPLFIFFSMNGILASTATAGALDGVPEMAGSGAALIGSLQYGSGVISSVLLAIFGSHLMSFSLIMLVFTFLSFACMWIRRK